MDQHWFSIQPCSGRTLYIKTMKILVIYFTNAGSCILHDTISKVLSAFIKRQFWYNRFINCQKRKNTLMKDSGYLYNKTG